jgi:hypothetical protein
MKHDGSANKLLSISEPKKAEPKKAEKNETAKAEPNVSVA